MEAEKDVNLEASAGEIFKNCVKIAAWCIEHEAEIKALVKKGWTVAKKIVEKKKKKYHK